MRSKPAFDAIIDLLAQHLAQAGVPESRSQEATEAIRVSVRSMPGAGWIDIEYLGNLDTRLLEAAEDRWIRVFKAWNAVPPEGSEGTRLRRDIEARFWEALEALRPH
jgi:hypothetical protein